MGHLVLYKSFLTIFNITNLKLIYSLRVLLFLSSISFVVATIVTQLSYTKIGSIFYKISAMWLGTLYLLFLACIIFAIIYFVFSFSGLSLLIPRVIGMVLFFFAVIFSIYGIYNSFDIKVTKYNVGIENLPESWAGKNIILFSDTHFGNIRNLKFGEKLITKVNEQNPSIVIIAGDYYDGPSVNAKEVALLMKDIKTEKGIYFASGNHEEYGDHNLFIESLISAGVEVLDNKSILVDDINIVGLDYASGSNKDIFENVFKILNLEKDIPKILIKHAPNLLLEVEKYKFDLVLSGHVHNGQIWPGPWLARKIFKEFSYGLNYLNEMAVVTSSGAGTWGPPQRLGTKSEIVVIKLELK